VGGQKSVTRRRVRSLAKSCAVQPLFGTERHGLAAERLHGDYTAVPILAKRKKRRISTYVRETTGRLAAGHHRQCSSLAGSAT
jgi:hypothetical protein